MYKCTLYDPLKLDPMEMEEITKEKVLDVLDRFPWDDLLNKMKHADEEEVEYAPSLDIENTANGQKLSITLKEEGNANRYQVFYERQKTTAFFFGLIKNAESLFSEREGLTLNEVREDVKALIADDFITLEKRWGDSKK